VIHLGRITILRVDAAWSSVVYLSVGLSQSWALQEHMKWSRCHLGCTLSWAQVTMYYMEVQIPRAKGQPSVKYRDSAVSSAKRQNQSRCYLRCGLYQAQWSMYQMGCTLAQPGKFDWTVHMRQRCGLMSNYFDHCFGIATCIAVLHALLQYFWSLFCSTHRNTTHFAMTQLA